MHILYIQCRSILVLYPEAFVAFFLSAVVTLTQEEQKELDVITAKRQKKGRNEEEAPAEEKTVLHGNVISMVACPPHVV